MCYGYVFLTIHISLRVSEARFRVSTSRKKAAVNLLSRQLNCYWSTLEQVNLILYILQGTFSWRVVLTSSLIPINLLFIYYKDVDLYSLLPEKEKAPNETKCCVSKTLQCMCFTSLPLEETDIKTTKHMVDDGNITQSGVRCSYTKMTELLSHMVATISYEQDHACQASLR